MSEPTIHVHRQNPLEKIPTYIGYCCREWVLATFVSGRCGLCGEIPTYLRPDTAEDDA